MHNIVTLDPGHGGSDPGAVGHGGLRESDMALDVCRRARDLLLTYCSVIMTRDSDSFVSLTRRADISNAARANVFVSYHFNSAGVPASGWEIYSTIRQNNSDRLATAIGTRHKQQFPQQAQRSDWSDGDMDKEANFSVIRRANSPAVLMEGEFIHTAQGESFIADPNNRQKMAAAVADGILDFLGIEVITPTIPPMPTLTLEQRMTDIERRLTLAGL